MIPLIKPERLASVTGPNPTRASMLRYNERLMNAFVPPRRHADEEDDAYQARYAVAIAAAQKLVRPPLLPILGHGQQLATLRREALAGANAGLPQLDTPVSRQTARRSVLKSTKAAQARLKAETIRTRRQKKSRAKA